MKIENEKSFDEIAEKEYKYGFVTDIESDSLPPGLNEDIVRQISLRKNEPEWLTEWRVKAYHHWTTLEEPSWAKVEFPTIDYQALSYYSAPKQKIDGPKSLDEIDPELLETYEKLGIPLKEQMILAGVEGAENAPAEGRKVAVDAVFDSVSVGTTFQ